MSDSYTRSGKKPGVPRSDFSGTRADVDSDSRGDAPFGTWWDQFLVRSIFAAACIAAGYHFHPFGLSPWAAALVGLLFSLAVFLFEIRLRRASLRRLIGAVT